VPAVTTNESPAATSNETTAASAAVSNETAGASAAVSNETAGASAAISNETAGASAAVSNETAGASAAISNETAAASAAISNETAAASAAISNETAGASTANPPVTPAVTTNESPSAATNNATAGASTANPPVTPAVTTNESPSAATSNETAAASSGNPQPSGPASIPLIQFQDVPITTAIENLTRQAGINYLLDPKIGYGQPDQNGQVKPEPTLSIRWENITAGQALLALLDNYGLQITEDHRTHISRISTKDPTAPPPLATRVLQIKYAGTSNLVDAIQASFTDKRSKVLPDVRTSQLVVVATENEQEALGTLISQLDKPTRQVLIETKLVEISSNPSTSKGVDWSGTLAAQRVTFGNGFMSGNTLANIPGIPVTTPGTTIPGKIIPGTPGSTTVSTTTTPGFGGHPGSTTSSTTIVPATSAITQPSTTTPGTTTTPSSTVSSVLNVLQGNGGVSWNTVSGFTPAIGFLNADGVSAVLSFLNAAYDAQVVSTPRVVTLDNQTATIEVTRTFPVINITGGTQNSAGSSSVTYSNVGTILQVTPRISANDYIWLRVIPVVSDHFGDITVTVTGGSGNSSTTYPVPVFDLRKMDSQVMIPDGDTLVMGGLIQDNPTATYSKVPLLGDIPGLGWAFRSETKNMQKDNLIIFMTPTIIKDSDFQPATSSAADFLKSKSPVLKSHMNPNSIWDGAEPHGDWSNPAPVPGEFDKK